MLGRKTYTQDELGTAQKAIRGQMAAYRTLVKAIDQSDPAAASALEAFEPLFTSAMTVTLDRHFVHRLRVSAGKVGNPLNEVEPIADSIMNNGGTLRGNNVIKYVSDDSIVKLKIGDTRSTSVPRSSTGWQEHSSPSSRRSSSSKNGDSALAAKLA